MPPVSGTNPNLRIGGVARWAKGLGLNFRVQAVGSEINSDRTAAYAPIPEGDNSNDIHGWRRMAADRDIGARQLLSDEAGTFVKGMAHQFDLWRGELGALPGGPIDLHLAPNEPAVLVIAPTRLAAVPPHRAAHKALDIGTNGWDVSFDDWHAGPTADTIRHEPARRHMTQLQPWSQLPGLEGMAGTASYTTHFHLADGQPLPSGELSLGTIHGTATISLNGSPAEAVNPFTGTVAVGRWLKPGENRLTVTVASSLNNRLLADHVADVAFGGPGPDSDGEAPPPAPAAREPAIAPDMIDGPKGLAGMQPGAAPPGGARTIIPFGLLGPVSLNF